MDVYVCVPLWVHGGESTSSTLYTELNLRMTILEDSVAPLRFLLGEWAVRVPPKMESRRGFASSGREDQPLANILEAPSCHVFAEKFLGPHVSTSLSKINLLIATPWQQSVLHMF